MTPTNDELFNAVTAAGRSVSAVGFLFQDVICLLADRLRLDHQALAAEVRQLYAPVDSEAAYQVVYNGYRERLADKLDSGAPPL